MVYGNKIPTERVLDKLDEYLNKKEFDGAKRHLNYWLGEAEQLNDCGGKLLILNEFMGLSRKLNEKEDAINYVSCALKLIDDMGISENVGSATTYLNSATVYKAFGMAEKSISLFEKAKEIYEKNLSPIDVRLGGLYNNMSLTLVDLKRFKEAETLYNKAIDVLYQTKDNEPEIAITYLNMASLKEEELGINAGKSEIAIYVERAKSLLESVSFRNDGNYAFVLEKCAEVFGHYGYDEYKNQLVERYKKIYERT